MPEVKLTSQLKTLIKAAEQDSDQVSMLTVLDDSERSEASIVVLKGEAVIECFRQWAERNGLFTRGKDFEGSRDPRLRDIPGPERCQPETVLASKEKAELVEAIEVEKRKRLNDPWLCPAHRAERLRRAAAAYGGYLTRGLIHLVGGEPVELTQEAIEEALTKGRREAEASGLLGKKPERY